MRMTALSWCVLGFTAAFATAACSSDDSTTGDDTSSVTGDDAPAGATDRTSTESGTSDGTAGGDVASGGGDLSLIHI